MVNSDHLVFLFLLSLACLDSAVRQSKQSEEKGQRHTAALFRNKGFLVNLKTERNASKFAVFMEKENPM